MENLGVNCSRKSRSPQQSIRSKSFLQNRYGNESQNKTYGTNHKIATGKEETFETGLPTRAKELNEKKKTGSDVFFPKRPSTVFSQKRPEVIERDRNLQTSKSFLSEPKEGRYNGRRSISRSRSISPRAQSKERQQGFNKQKLKCLPKNPINNYAENFESLSLLRKAVYEQGQVIETFGVAREELLKKMAEKMSDRKSEFEYPPTSGRDSNFSCFPDFENSYRGTLEEIFQVWVHLFYFIINLRINLIRILNSVSTEPFRPKGDVEKEIIKQAIESVKFFSLLKIKSMADALDHFHLPNGQYMTQTQIKNYEQQLSSPFLSDMNYIQKKAKEILSQAKAGTNL